VSNGAAHDSRADNRDVHVGILVGSWVAGLMRSGVDRSQLPRLEKTSVPT
jgi:hypothetical protein